MRAWLNGEVRHRCERDGLNVPTEDETAGEHGSAEAPQKREKNLLTEEQTPKQA